MHYILDHIPRNHWKVISFKLNEFAASDEALIPYLKARVDYCLSFPHPTLPSISENDLLWFQHAFGMWRNVNDHFLNLLQEAKRRGNKVAASFHTIHFQSEETPSGMDRKEEELLKETLPLVDALTVFTNGAYRAVLEAFPEYARKVMVLRHGVHLYTTMSQHEARKRFFSYLVNQAEIPQFQKIELSGAEDYFHSRDTILLGNYGFITSDKDPSQLFELGRLVQEKLPKHRVVTLFAGIIQRNKNTKLETNPPILEVLRSSHDGKENFFFEVYIPEDIFPMAFRALDFTVFWCNNATQSGRLAHAQGAGSFVVGRDWEGIGETLKLSGLPAAESLSELAEMIAELVLEPALKKKLGDESWQYIQRYYFVNQAKKHLLIEKVLATGRDLPALDSEQTVEIRDWKRGGIYEHEIVSQGEERCTLQ
jgi:glycosyltransferase involved in cell wall biosynthesis